MNPDTLFRKELMDDAFRYAISKAYKANPQKRMPGLNPEDVEKLLKRVSLNCFVIQQ